MFLAKSEKVKPSRCPFCAYKLNGAAGMVAVESETAKPSPGDFSVCIECANVLIFDKDLSLRRPTYEEARESRERPDVMQARDIIGRMIASRPVQIVKH